MVAQSLISAAFISLVDLILYLFPVKSVNVSEIFDEFYYFFQLTITTKGGLENFLTVQ